MQCAIILRRLLTWAVQETDRVHGSGRVFAVLGCWAAVDGFAATELWLLRKLGLESIPTSFKASTPPSFRSDIVLTKCTCHQTQPLVENKTGDMRFDLFN